MYRNLNTVALGITGRQSELIELALTYGFRGLDVDMGAVSRRARAGGVAQAGRFVASAGVCVGEFTLPVSLTANEATFRAGLAGLGELAEVASSMDALRCRTLITPVCEDAAYHEYFEMHRLRLADVADILAPHNIRLGVAFTAARAQDRESERPFIRNAEALMTLIKTVGRANVGLALDTWDWFVGGGRLDQLLGVPVTKIVAVRLADTPEGADVSSLDAHERLMPGQGGAIDCRAIVQHLQEQDYDGPVTLYPDPSQFVGMTREAIVQQAKSVLDYLLKAPVPDDEAAAAEEPSDSVSASADAS